MFQALFWALSGTPFSYLPYYTPSRLKIKAFPFPRAFTAYDMYLSSHTRGIPKKSGSSDQFRTYSGPLLALRSGSGPSPEFRTLVVPLPKYWICLLSISHIGLETTFTSILEFTSLITFLAILSAPKPNALLAKQDFGRKSKKRKMMHGRYSTQCAEIFTFDFLFVSLKSKAADG